MQISQEYSKSFAVSNIKRVSNEMKELEEKSDHRCSPQCYYILSLKLSELKSIGVLDEAATKKLLVFTKAQSVYLLYDELHLIFKGSDDKSMSTLYSYLSKATLLFSKQLAGKIVEFDTPVQLFTYLKLKNYEKIQSVFGKIDEKKSLTEILANKELDKSQRFGTIFTYRIVTDGTKKFARYSLDFDYSKLDKIVNILVETRIQPNPVYSPEN